MANSTITVSQSRMPAQGPVVVPMGTEITISINAAPDELLSQGLRLQAPGASHGTAFRTVRPENADGSNAYGFGGTSFYPAGNVTSFVMNTLNILPGTYRLISLVYDPHHQLIINNGVELVGSNSFTVTAGVSDDLLPAVSAFANIGDWINAVVIDITTTDPKVMALYGADGTALNSVNTGDLVLLAVNTNNMQEVQNNVFFRLDQGNGNPEFVLLEVFPFSEYINDSDFLAISNIPAGGLIQGVRYKIFYIPPHQRFTEQVGQLTVSLAHRSPADTQTSLTLQLVDDPVITLEDNSGSGSISGEPIPLQTQRVTIATIGADYPSEHYQAFADEIRDFFNLATRGYFAIEVDFHHYRLEGFNIDYAAWWNGLPKDPEGDPLDPANPDELLYIQLIYANEHDMINQAFLEVQHPLQADDEDITLYMVMRLAGAGGAMQNACEIQTHFASQLISDDWKVDGVYRAPSTMIDPATIFDTAQRRAFEANICVHEIGHTFWKRPIRREIGHANSYHMHEAQGGGNRFYRFLRYLDSVDQLQARISLGWGNTLMSYARNRSQLNQRMLSDQLGPLVPLYAPPELEFGVKDLGASLSSAVSSIQISAGTSVEFVLQGSSASGLRMMWYFERGIQAITRRFSYGSIESYQRTYDAVETDILRFDSPGEYVYQANCRDILYFIPHGGMASNANTIGNAHQASENGGLREVTVTVV